MCCCIVSTLRWKPAFAAKICWNRRDENRNHVVATMDLSTDPGQSLLTTQSIPKPASDEALGLFALMTTPTPRYALDASLACSALPTLPLDQLEQELVVSVASDDALSATDASFHAIETPEQVMIWSGVTFADARPLDGFFGLHFSRSP